MLLTAQGAAMDWQMVVTGGCVAAAAVYVARQTWRTWLVRGKGCGGCGCAAKTAAAKPPAANLISTEMLTARLRGRGMSSR